MQQPQPRVFHYSLDWRFLLPIADAQEIYLLVEEENDFRETLQMVGIDSAQQFSLKDLQQQNHRDLQSIVMPFGVPAGWAAGGEPEEVELYKSVRRLLAPHGHFLIGFQNTWDRRPSSHAKYQPSTPHRIRTQLIKSGFRDIQLYGVIPNLAIPEYIFALESRSIQFALQNRFRRKPAVLHVLRVLASTMGMLRVSNFLPCYFALASA